MATCEDIITRALRRLKVLDESEAPSAEHAVTGMEALQDLFDNAVMAVALTDVVVTANYTAGENERIRLSGGAWTITYPTTISDDGDRDPYDLRVVVVAGATPVHKIYDAQLASWVTVSGLTLADDCPLSTRNAKAISGLLAGQLAEEYGRQIGPMLKADASHGRSLLNRFGGRTYTDNVTFY